eukprot:1148300-Pyramimonas_sp.AAC.1
MEGGAGDAPPPETTDAVTAPVEGAIPKNIKTRPDIAIKPLLSAGREQALLYWLNRTAIESNMFDCNMAKERRDLRLIRL